jgi:hypothetical protein
MAVPNKRTQRRPRSESHRSLSVTLGPGDFEGSDFGLTHFVCVTFIMKENELFDPLPVSLFSSGAIVPEADSGAELIDELRLVHEGLPVVNRC